ncbi:MAG TPA: hypothetical protein VM658_06375 [bacterium]|nr:hypothetical protein [bacterium]
MKKIVFESLVLALALGLAWSDVEIFRAEYHFQKGEDKKGRPDYAGALEQYEMAAAILPDRYSYQRAVGKTSYKLYDPGSGNLRPLYQSYEAYQRVLALDPHYPYGWFEMADVLDEFERAKVSGLDSPEPYFRRALEIDPSNPRFLAGLLDWKLRHGQNEAAWGLFLELIRSYPYAVVKIGPAMLKTDRDFARLGREIDVGGPAAIEYAKYLVRVRRMEEAQGLLTRLEGQKAARLVVAGLMSDVYMSRGETAKARETLSNALAAAPGDLALNSRLVKVFMKERDDEGAIAVYKKAFTYHPGRWELASAAAGLAMKIGHDDEAIDLFTQALDTGKPDANTKKRIYELRAKLRAKRHDFGGAIADYEKILDLDPDNENAIHAIKKVKIEMEYAGHSGR